MQIRHMPKVDGRYWSAIAMASLFGTNLGDLYAHDSGLGLIGGVPVLVALAAVVFAVERLDRAPRQGWYWLMIVIIRTGATNIADYGKHQMPYAVFGAILTVLLVGFATLSLRPRDRAESVAEESRGMPKTGAAYWAAMLSAGIFGTFFGDVAQHVIGQGMASLVLLAALLVMLAIWRAQGANRLWLYWLTVAMARTAGTAMGDFLAENETLAIGLPVATLITGTAFTLIVLLWPRRNRDVPATAT
ncbi:hypothetical protein HZF05_09440 [Sphingomonas sp. CGMCC 1.13654]|uniref:Uncharacterized protein n=1 Tax=Sphingomonas chungangi TaxID=2683589 RepID=A0A838L5W4_9SPHN|nr:hypothetical protein [Sphingomonas chungangi]MBA2934320.1 hypothetical protein [Sphingomonas chungangi]MVW57361.1 hypothetical protein [Sphingomonas chungangi]